MGGDWARIAGGIYPRGFSPKVDWPWPLVKASDLVQLNYGKAMRDGDRRPGSIPVYGTNGRCGWHDEALAEGPGVVLGRKGQGPLGVEWCDSRFWVIDTAYYVIRKTKDLDLRYFYYLVKYVGLNHLKDGTSNPSLSRDTFGDLLLPNPPIETQLAIAHVLRTLDDKVELNRRMNETLEAIAKALFKSWFVDFDPVRAKAEGRDHGLPKPIADLFPESFEDSELGAIPEGWNMGTLGDHFDVVKGVSYKGSGLTATGMPLHNLNSVYEGGGYKYEGIKHYNSEYAQRHLVLPGDVIVANTEQGHHRLLIGYAAIVPRLFGERGIASHHIYCMRPKAGSAFTAAYICALLNSPKMHDVVSGYANGTTVNMLPAAGVQQPKIVVPPIKLVTAFNGFATQVEWRREEMVVESRTLAAIRDTLLPKLISGELRVADIARTGGT